jgi:hypothetical protein
MLRVLVVVFAMLALTLGCPGCGPAPTQDARSAPPSVGDLLCPQCGGERFDVQRHVERTGPAGEERVILEYACQGCGHSWRAPTLGG